MYFYYLLMKTVVKISNSNSHKLKTVNISCHRSGIEKSLKLFTAQMRNYSFTECC